MDSKRILIATPHDGGPATYSRLLSEKLPAYSFKIEVVNFGTVIFLPKMIRHIAYFLKLLRLGLRVDGIYAQDPVSVGFPALLAARILRKPLYIKIVGDYAWEQGSQRFGVRDFLDDFSITNDKYPFPVRMLKKVQYFVAMHADKIIVPSNYLKKIVSNWGVPSEKITVIYNAFDPPEVNEVRDELRAKYGFTGSVIVSSGRLVPWKGFDTVITLMPEVLRMHPDAKLFIVGEGPDKTRLNSLIGQSKLEESITMVGKISHKEMLEYLKAGDLFVLNTSYEGLSHLLLEALAMSVPVITTRVGGNVETIENDANGILVEYNNKNEIVVSIHRLLSDRNEATRLAENGRKKIADFNEKRMLDALSRVLS